MNTDTIMCHLEVRIDSKKGDAFTLRDTQNFPVRPVCGDIISLNDDGDEPALVVEQVTLMNDIPSLIVRCFPVGFDDITVYDMLDIDGWTVDEDDEARLREEWMPNYMKEAKK